jgi:hypothetical protein
MGRRKGTCAYCDAPSTTLDHIPPKGLFGKPFPLDLVTVPSCRSCNVDAAKDDEYFRTVMAFRHDTFDRPDAGNAAERAMRSLVRPGGEGFRKGLLSKVSEIPVFDDEGVRLGSIGQLDVDLRRIRKVMERIVRGLYYYYQRQRLPPECRVTVNTAESFEAPDAGAVEKLREVVRWAMSAEKHVLSRGVLEYRVRETRQDPACAVWLLAIYQTVPFVVITARKQPSA